MSSVCVQGKPFSITVIQVCAPTTDAKEAEVDQFWEDLKDLLEVTPKKKKNLFYSSLGIWNAKVRNQETPGVTSKFDLEVQNEAWQSLTEFLRENMLAIGITLFEEPKRQLYTWTSPDSQY